MFKAFKAGQVSGFQDICSLSEFFTLEGTRNHILDPINGSVSVPYCTDLTLHV